MKKPNYYDILDIDKGSTQAEIKSAYNSLSKAYHPDSSKHPRSEKKMREINEAYQTLSDLDKRKSYDYDIRNNSQETKEKPKQEYNRSKKFKYSPNYMYIDPKGYPRYKNSKELVHRHIAETYILNRKIKPYEVVHHIDGNKLNFSPDNLEVFEKETAWQDHNEHHKKEWGEQKKERYGQQQKATQERQRKETRNIKIIAISVAIIFLIIFLNQPINSNSTNLDKVYSNEIVSFNLLKNSSVSEDNTKTEFDKTQNIGISQIHISGVAPILISVGYRKDIYSKEFYEKMYGENLEQWEDLQKLNLKNSNFEQTYSAYYKINAFSEHPHFARGTLVKGNYEIEISGRSINKERLIELFNEIFTSIKLNIN